MKILQITIPGAAVMLTEAQADSNRRAEPEAQCRRKRDALRNTQRAQAEAKRRAAEAQRQCEEAEYLAQFGVLPPVAEPVTEELSGNVPMAVIPDAENSEELQRRNEEGNQQ